MAAMRKAYPHSTKANLALAIARQKTPFKAIPVMPKTPLQVARAKEKAEDKRRRRRQRNIRIHLQF
jgi:hypothetical protein